MLSRSVPGSKSNNPESKVVPRPDSVQGPQVPGGASVLPPGQNNQFDSGENL